ncbi:MAG TPA: shikimate dehydrogenase [Stackebrandtia sp.]|nr:shikimate dehydrogenase [Stackebrandtia sp.]HZE38783.1 shikimate dehydrogenase [Stackebrandtia sp.]
MSTRRDYLIGLIGSGIGPSLSPALHEREADELGLRYLYRRLDLDALGLAPAACGDLLAAARLVGYDGLNITHPCKQTVLAHLDDLSADAAALGAVNTVTFADGRAIGHNTDWSGFARAFTLGLADAATGHVVLLGAGGAGSAVAHALMTLGARRIEIFDVDDSRSDTLAEDLTTRFGPDRAVSASFGDDVRLATALRDADGLVHATPTGMTAHPGLPFASTLLHPRCWVAEIVYRPLETPLLAAARGRGCRVLDGGRMAVLQAAESFRLFTGADPDPDRMRRHFQTLIGTESHV